MLISTDLANEYKQLLQNMKHEDLFKPYGTSSYSYVAMKENQYTVTLPMYLSKVWSAKLVSFYSHTHTQADTVV